MIIENEIPYEGELSLDAINQEPLPLVDTDVLDERTDKRVSIKMTDKEGRTILLLEAMPDNLDDKEVERNIQGCYIRRFEYVRDMLHHPFYIVFDKFIRSFVTRIKYDLVPLPSGEFFTNYQYVWTQKDTVTHCIIAEVLGLKPEPFGDLFTYKGIIPQQ